MIDYSFSIGELEYFLVVLSRVACFVLVVPFFNMGNTPRRFRICLSIFIAYLIYQTGTPHEELVYSTILEYSLIIMKECVVGILIGFGALVCNSIILFAGRNVDMEIGFSMVNAMDPSSRENATITGLFYQYTFMLIFMISGLFEYLIQALNETFQLIPVNGAIFNRDALMEAFIKFMGEYLNIGFRICLPVFCCTLIVNVILGILAKVAPQMNMFAVGMQIRIFVGLGVMFLTVGMLPYAADFIYTEMKTIMVSFVKAMMA